MAGLSVAPVTSRVAQRFGELAVSWFQALERVSPVV
jgi:hypothetical protein